MIVIGIILLLLILALVGDHRQTLTGDSDEEY
jgi:hypothetical protein